MEKKNTGLSIASLVLGIIALISSVIPYVNVISYLLGLLAIIFAIVTFVNKKAKKGLAIAGLIISLIAITAATIMNVYVTKIIVDKVKENPELFENVVDDDYEYKTSEEILKTDVKITFGKFSSTTSQYGYTTSELPVTVKNIAKTAKTYSFSIEAYDSNGELITSDFISTKELKPGEKEEIKAFKYVLKDDLEKMKTAKIKVKNAYAF